MGEVLPGAKVVRLGAAGREPCGIEEAMAEGMEVVIGTPAVAKGPVIPGMSLAAVVDVDAVLASSDFRAAERAFQLVRGLSGRLERGEVIVQTRHRDHYAIEAATAGEPDRFYERELEVRREFRYPPFAQLARLVYPEGRDSAGRDATVSSALRGHAVEVLGPVAHPRRRAHRMILLKGEERAAVRDACIAARQAGDWVEVDLDPSRV